MSPSRTYTTGRVIHKSDVVLIFHPDYVSRSLIPAVLEVGEPVNGRVNSGMQLWSSKCAFWTGDWAGRWGGRIGFEGDWCAYTWSDRVILRHTHKALKQNKEVHIATILFYFPNLKPCFRVFRDHDNVKLAKLLFF